MTDHKLIQQLSTLTLSLPLSDEDIVKKIDDLWKEWCRLDDLQDRFRRYSLGHVYYFQTQKDMINKEEEKYNDLLHIHYPKVYHQRYCASHPDFPNSFTGCSRCTK